MNKAKYRLITLVVLAGISTFGCTDLNNENDTTADLAPGSDAVTQDTTTDTSPDSDVVKPGTNYKDGTYSAEGKYTNPSGEDSIKVKLTIKDDIVTHLEVNGEADDEKSESYQNMFIEGIEEKVVGKDLDEIHDIGNVNGSGLTQEGFEDAMDKIREEAKDEEKEDDKD